jgi:hypothetical protein
MEPGGKDKKKHEKKDMNQQMFYFTGCLHFDSNEGFSDR